MLIVRPVKDKKLQEELCRKANAKYDTAAFAYLAANSDDLGDTYTSFIGLVQFDIDAEGGILTTVDMMPGIDDMEAMVIMGRSLMCFLYRDLHIKALRAAEGVDAKYSSAFGLRNTDGTYRIDLEDFYKSPCKYNNLV